MVIRDETSSVEITRREVGQTGTPAAGDLGVDVAVTAGATVAGGPFSGRNHTVWIGREAWHGFVEDLRELERTRRGDAAVLAMSPAEFQLTLFVTDRAGHLAAEGWVGRQHAGRSAAAQDRVCFRIQLDPSTLVTLAHEFEALTPAG